MLGYLHYHEHHGRAMCSECNVFIDRADWQRHMEIFHPDSSRECAYCTASFTTLARLTKHEAEKHTGPWYMCSGCKTVFKSRRGITGHVCASAKASQEDGCSDDTLQPAAQPGPSE